MDHVAILKDAPLDKILDGAKTIESRWLANKSAPWDKVRCGDAVFFKRSGGNVEAWARVKEVRQYENVNNHLALAIIREHGAGLAIDEKSLGQWHNRAKTRCCLLFLDDVRQIKPFAIDKTGFGAMAAWLCLERGIDAVKRKS
jgi:ASC-1-like (ASCH) protein